MFGDTEIIAAQGQGWKLLNGQTEGSVVISWNEIGAAVTITY